MKYKTKNEGLMMVCLMPIFLLLACVFLFQANILGSDILPHYFFAGAIIIQLVVTWIYLRFKQTNALYNVCLNNFSHLSEGKIVLDEAQGSSAIVKEFNTLLKDVTQYYSEVQKVAINISNGNLNVSYQPKTSEDVLGGTLINLKDKLIKINEEERARAWSSNGIAEFVSLLREEAETNQLCTKVLSFIIKYINANQGSIYLLEKNGSGEDVFVTAAMYAFGRKKYSIKEIYPGDGLLGQCYFERDIILLTDVPCDYVSITSGLGESLPRCIILIPLLYNDEIQGVIEIASFQVWSDYEINFLKRVSEYLASTLSGLKVTQQTRGLLEKADRLNQELNDQSEGMRQNMEELRATQEEMERKNLEFSGLYFAVNQTMAVADLSVNGEILKVNEIFSALSDQATNILVGMNIQQFINSQPTGLNCDEILERVSQNETFNGTFLTNSDNDSKWLSGTFSPMKNESQEVVRILFLATDISVEKKLQMDMMTQAEELNKKMNEIEAERKKNVAILEGCVDAVISFDSKGTVNFFNKAAEEIWEIKRSDVIGVHIKEFIPIEISISNESINVYYIGESGRKELSVRTEVVFRSSKGESVDGLLTLTSATLGNEYNFTCFVQKISVDLF